MDLLPGMNGVKHIFFDLDHTLWDFEKNSSETLRELIQELEINLNIDEFIAEYQKINAIYWRNYRNGEITKDVVRTGRFLDTLNLFGIQDSNILAGEMGQLYVERSPMKNNLFPFTHETLRHLKAKYPLHIITNGFSEIVSIKLHHSYLTHYFDVVICAEELGEKKPHPSVFETALKNARAKASESLMIGDNYEVDIQGAANCGMQTIFFNPTKEKIDHTSKEITCLSELQILL